MLHVYTLAESKTWDKIVRSFSACDVFYLSGYVRGFQIHGDGNPILLFYEDNNIRGINVVMKRDISLVESLSRYIDKEKYYDLTTAYGYGGWIIESLSNDYSSVDMLNEEYLNWCNRNGIVCEFVRFHPLLKNWKQVESFYDVVNLGSTVFIDTSSEDIIWKNVSSKNRNMIRKAIKSGLKTYWCRDPQIIELFMEIYNQTMERDNATKYYYFSYEFYESIIEDLKDNCMWFYTMKENQIAAISIVLFENGKMHYHLSASRHEFQHLAPTNLLLYEVALWGCRQGYKYLHLGGGVGSSHDSLYRFKKAFNRNTDGEFCIGRKIFNDDVYKKLVDFRKLGSSFDMNSLFFPKYRM